MLPVVACQTVPAPVQTIKVSAAPIKKIVPKQHAPRPLALSNPKFYVVTEKNFDDFKKRFLAENKDFVYIAISPGDYNKINANNAELLRYIKQQKSIIVYYEGNLD